LARAYVARRPLQHVAAPGHAELVRTLVFDGMTGGEAAAVRSWMARVLARLE